MSGLRYVDASLVCEPCCRHFSQAYAHSGLGPSLVLAAGSSSALHDAVFDRCTPAGALKLHSLAASELFCGVHTTVPPPSPT